MEGTSKKKILLIVPLPPPVTGQSTISLKIYDYIKNNFEITVLNYARSSLKKSSIFSIGQMIKSIIFLIKIIKEKNKFDLAYINLSASFFGNLKDILFLLSFGKKLRRKSISHIHTGTFFDYIEKINPVIKFLNKIVLKEINSFIVLSNSFKEQLSKITESENIIKIDNFFNNEMLLDYSIIKKKWSNPEVINIIFISNMLKEKGYLDLLYGFINLEKEFRNKFNLYFAGNFYNKKLEKEFLSIIKNQKDIFYLSHISGKNKIELFKKAHALFLPSYFKEGQPLAILESYASGCVVFTSQSGGIKDIFVHNKNGKYLTKNKTFTLSITESLLELYNSLDKYKEMAFYNRECSKQFTEETFFSKIDNIINKIINK